MPNPVVVFEVLSTSTASEDRIAKNEEYRRTPSIQHCVMLEQASRAATVFSRQGDELDRARADGRCHALLP